MKYGVGAAAGSRAEDGDWVPPPAAIAAPFSTRLDRDPSSPQPHALPACPELDCIRHLLPPGLIAAAELRAAEAGVGADRALIAADIISEEAYLAALTASHDIVFEPLDDLHRSAVILSDAQLLDAASTGILPITTDGNLHFVVAPRALSARWLAEGARNGSELASRMRVTTAERMQTFIARHGAQAIARRATEALHDARPALSARSCKLRPAVVVALLATLVLTLISIPSNVLSIFSLAMTFIFLAWSGLRMIMPFTIREPIHPQLNLSDDRLPVYSIIVALYQEAAVVKRLATALRRLNYPKEKLQILIVLESDDRETRARLDAMRLAAPFKIVIAPPGTPRTKPRALNAALPFARGTFVAVYDAEDRPEPDQLRRALDAFATGGNQLACVQARLTIDNTADGWLARLFTAEYAGLFDVFLPSLAARKLPLPLGGSSNHFHTATLRQVGAWDPYNVTEDADLGMRLARDGYHTTVIASSTYEEAPARIAAWLKQRTRWFKGWMQTWLVHMRAPRRLFRELGPAGFTAFQMLAGGSVFAALVHPFFLAAFLWEMATVGAHAPNAPVYGATILIGYLVSAGIAFAGLKRRRLLDCAWALLLMPVYWLLLSLAAWRALDQLVRDPYRWEKTEHGLARNSRLLDETGALTASVRSSAAGRPRRPRGGA